MLFCEYCKIFKNTYFEKHLRMTAAHAFSFDSCAILENSIYVGFLVPEAVAQIRFVKKVFIEISQNSQENTCARVSFLIKFLKNRPWHSCFTVSFVKFLRAPFFTEHLRWLFLLFILVASIVVTWVSQFSRHKFKLEVEDFIFHILQRNFQISV